MENRTPLSWRFYGRRKKLKRKKRVKAVHEDERTERTPALTPPASAKAKKKKQLPSLDEKLFSTIMDLLFCWASRSQNRFKSTILRLTMSSANIRTTGSLFSKPSLYSLHLIQRTPRRDVLTLLSSQEIWQERFRTIIMFFKAKTKFHFCYDLLSSPLCSIGFPEWEYERCGHRYRGKTNHIPTALTNAFRYFLVKLHRPQDFDSLEITDKPRTPIESQLPTKWNAAGIDADFMVNPALTIALANSAPHFKDLTVTAPTRLIQLFTSFSNPLFLRRSPQAAVLYVLYGKTDPNTTALHGETFAMFDADTGTSGRTHLSFG
ncbi:hypothetical protein Hypma_016622 [Hypsizygus marmoreus]|uniref:Uncharacterized protein n=1 Tax=Hypsizygus marmoreus TaxID=39966 RepID=A0A369IXK0_HYPMA|nr:hypothetical protein Hypma_016622 [Hypsizygus marmoreus]